MAIRRLLRRVLHAPFDLRKSSDFLKAKSTIHEGVALRGYNLWLLVCSTVLASIGLDTNSTAVIIGAMLISPLMSPILGVGLSVAILDREILLRSFRNLFIAIAISLLSSIVYFYLSPLGEPTAELEARTFPTLLDVMIALFGGIAGIVSISRHGQTIAIPGVAIATALMPPLCTAGFGIATARWEYFFGAFYLFFINAVFISFATFLIAKYLRFPVKDFVNRHIATRYHRGMIILSILALGPSCYFLYTLYKNEVIKKEIELLVLSPIKNQGNEILKWEIVQQDTSRLIKVYHSGLQVSDSLTKAIDSSLATHQMGVYHLLSMRVNLTKEEVNALSAEMTRQMFREMHLDEIRQPVKNTGTALDTVSHVQLLREIRIIFPTIDTLTNGWMLTQNKKAGFDTLPVAFYTAKAPIGSSKTKQLYDFLRARIGVDTLLLFRK